MIDLYGEFAREVGYRTEAEPMSLARGQVQILRFVKLDPDGEDYLNLGFLLVTPAAQDVRQDRDDIERPKR